MPNPPLTRISAGVYHVIIDGKHLADVTRQRYPTQYGRPYTVWVIRYAMRQIRWQREETFSRFTEARAWIGGHLEELAKGET